MKKVFAVMIAVALCAALCIATSAAADPDTWLCLEDPNDNYTTGYWSGPAAGFPDGSDINVTFTTPNAFKGFVMACYASTGDTPAVLDLALLDEDDNELETLQVTVDYDHPNMKDTVVNFSKAYAKGTYTIQMVFADGQHFVLACGDVNEDIDVAVFGVNNNQYPEKAPAIKLLGAEAPAGGEQQGGEQQGGEQGGEQQQGGQQGGEQQQGGQQGGNTNPSTADASVIAIAAVAAVALAGIAVAKKIRK